MALDLKKYKLPESEIEINKYKLAIPQATPSLAQRIWDDLSQRGSRIVEEIQKPGQAPIVSGFKATANLFGGIGDVGGEIIQSIPGVRDIATKTGDIIEQGFSKVVNYASPIGQKLYDLEQSNPQIAKGITDFLEIASASGEISGNILVAEGLKTGAAKSLSTAKAGIENTFKALTEKSVEDIEKTIIKKFEKGVRPNLPGKTTPTQLSDYRDDIVIAAKTIKDNKAVLNLTDEFEGKISGELPKSLQQLSEAIEQTKKSVFTQYDELTKKAGKAGLKIDTTPIGKELDTIINNEALQLSHPETIKYAESVKQRYSVKGKFGRTSFKNLDATVTQDVIQNYNNSLQAFYRNPTFENASRAAVDAMLANKLREALDTGINKLTGSEYQVLKNQYGSLKAIERDVIKATLRDARKNVKGLVDFADIFSGGQVVSGILNLSPAQIASGLTQKAITEYIKFLNNPNRAIEAMFKAAEELP